MVTVRRGAGSLGCLFTLMLVAAALYFAFPVGEAYFRYYRFEDQMKQEMRFSKLNSDAEILRDLRLFADSSGLPPAAAANVAVQRAPGRIIISSAYIEEFHLPGYVRIQPFAPRAEGVY